MIPQGQASGGAATHERRDVDVVGLVMIIGLLFLILTISLLVCLGVLRHLKRDQVTQKPPRLQMVEQAAKFPQPQLITEPGSEEARTELAAKTKLETYGWVDRQAGVARIPIARAMQVLAARGLPEVGAGQTRLRLRQARPQTDVQPNEPITSPIPEATP